MSKCSCKHIDCKEVITLVELFKALSEESRLRILALVIEGEMCVCEIEACLNLTQSNASRHLTVLKKCGILESYKNAQWTFYRIDESFKKKHTDLWSYLVNNLNKLPTYHTDLKEYEKCTKKDLCTNLIV